MVFRLSFRFPSFKTRTPRLVRHLNVDAVGYFLAHKVCGWLGVLGSAFVNSFFHLHVELLPVLMVEIVAVFARLLVESAMLVLGAAVVHRVQVLTESFYVAAFYSVHNPSPFLT